MKLFTATVVDGKIEIPSGCLAEGEDVGILARDSEEFLQLTVAEEEELIEALEQVRRGQFVDGMELLEEIRRGGEA